MWTAPAHSTQQKQSHLALPNGRDGLLCLLTGNGAPSVCRANKLWNESYWIEQFMGEAWSAENRQLQSTHLQSINPQRERQKVVFSLFGWIELKSESWFGEERANQSIHSNSSLNSTHKLAELNGDEWMNCWRADWFQPQQIKNKIILFFICFAFINLYF